MFSKVQIATTAVIEPDCHIGEGTRVWHFSHVMSGARIGEGCTLGKGVQVAGGAVVGNRVKIQNNVSVYDGVVVQDEVFLGPSCVLTNVSNPRATINQRDRFEQTLLGRGCTIGANSTVICGVTIGPYAFVAAGAVVTADVPPYALVMGTPARQVGWVGRRGVRLAAADSSGKLHCPETGEVYREVDGRLAPIIDLEGSTKDGLAAPSRAAKDRR